MTWYHSSSKFFFVSRLNVVKALRSTKKFFSLFFAVCLVTSLTCMQCYSRVHKGCTNLDYAVRHQECVGDEVCAKFSTWRMKRGPNGVMIPYGMQISLQINKSSIILMFVILKTVFCSLYSR